MPRGRKRAQPKTAPSPTQEELDLNEALMRTAAEPAGLNIQAAEGGFSVGGDQSAVRTPMLYLDPLFDQILILFPQDNLRELNRRLRHYYKYDPYIRSIIDFHTETPLSDFELRMPGCAEGEDYFNNFKNEKNLLNMLINTSRDYWLLGESFHYGNWDDVNQEFSDFVQFPPEEMEIHGAYIDPKRAYVLRPNKEISKLLRSSNPADRLVSQHLYNTAPKIADAISRNKPHLLDSNRLFVMQRTMAGYINRGVSPLLSVIKDLLYQDNLILFRNAFIQRHSYPLKIFKLGSEAKGFIPSRKMFNDFRVQLINAVNDPDFNIITHPFLDVNYYSGSDKILPLIPYFELVQKRIFAGLFVNEGVVSGEKTPYAAGVTFMRGLMNRYLTIRNNMEIEIKRKVFSPLSRIRKFYNPTPAEVSHRVKTRRDESRLLVPTFSWQKANLLSNQAIMQMVLGLREKKEIPFRFVAEMFGWELDDIIYQLKREEGTRIDPTWKDVKSKIIEKDEDLSWKLLLGDDIDEAIKAKYKEGSVAADEEEAEEKPSKKKKKDKAGGDFVLPEVAPAKDKVDTEAKRPSELKGEKDDTAPGELGDTDRKPRPNEGETPVEGEGGEV